MTSRILVVEDDDATRYLTSRMLAEGGYDVAQAHDFRDALPVLEDGNPISLMLTDLVMPGVNGFALARMARMRRHSLKVVYMTAYDHVPSGEAVGPIMRKPIGAEALLSLIRDTLQAG